MNADELMDAFPRRRVNPDVLFVDDGHIITSAGTAAGIDACLHLVRRELGAAVATPIARRMVVPPQRDGGQRQFVDLPIPECATDSLRSVLAWMEEHLDEDQPVRRARPPRGDVRPHLRPPLRRRDRHDARQWLLAQRVHRARELLESTDLGIETVASAPASARPHCCDTTSRVRSASPRPTTGERSAPRTCGPAEPATH